MKVRKGSIEEIPLIQGKRNPSKMVGVARGHQRADTMKPSHVCRPTQDRRVMVDRSDRTWSTGEGNGKPLQYSCLENPMNSMKRQNDRRSSIQSSKTRPGCGSDHELLIAKFRLKLKKVGKNH